MPAQVARLFQMCRLPKALPYSRLSSRTIPLSNSTHILACKVAKGFIIRQGYISYKGKDYKGESDKEEGGAEL